MRRLMLVLAAWFAIVAPTAAQAYIGPGAGLSAIGSLLALVAAVFVAIFGFLWYPIKSWRKRRQAAQAPDVPEAPPAPAAPQAAPAERASTESETSAPK
jgi:hypothetical protein